MISIIAVLCSIATAECRERVITSTQFQPLTMADCNNEPKIVEWSKQYPADRLKSWKCVLGNRPEKT